MSASSRLLPTRPVVTSTGPHGEYCQNFLWMISSLEQIVAGGRRLELRRGRSARRRAIRPMRTNQLSLRQNAPPPTRCGGMRGTLLPSVKVARTVSYWPSTPKMPGPSGVTSHCHASSAPRKIASRWEMTVCSSSVSDAAGGELLAAENAGRLLEDEVVVAGVVGLAVEAEVALGPLEADLDGLGGLDGEAGIADVEGLRRVVRALGEQLDRPRRALDALQGSGSPPDTTAGP